MSAWAKPGVKCVCIKKHWTEFEPGEVLPYFGQVLTVRDVEINDGKVALFFVEIVNEPAEYSDGYGEVNFLISNFRPLITRTQDQDLEHFLPLLNSVEELA